MESFDPVTRQGLSITNLFWLELAISGVLLAMVVGVLAVAVLRFRARPTDTADPRQVEGNRRVEFIWTATPTLILVVMFVLMVGTMRTVDAEQPAAQPLVIVGRQWWWQFSYPGQQVVSANELHVPTGTPLQIELQSADVIHDLHVPHFGWMQDAVPGKTNTMWVIVDRPGEFLGACNQYCGLQHAWMRIKVIAETPDQFATWAQAQAQPVTPGGSAGEQVFLQNTCVACHAIRGLRGATGAVGPDLTHLGSRTTLGAGVIDNSPEHLKAWIANPQAIKPGVLMPSFQTLSDTDLTALTDYLESLK